MIKVLDSFRHYSSTNIINIKTKETFESYTFSFELNDVQIPLKWSDLNYMYSLLNSRDSLSLSITVDGVAPFSFQLDSNTISLEQTEMLENVNDIIEESEIAITYTITKNKINDTISIYDFSNFTTFLDGLKLQQLLNHLQRKIDFTKINKFELQDDTENKIYFKSNLIVWYSKSVSNFNIEVINTDERSKRLDVRKFNTNPQSFSDYTFIPEDFTNHESDTNHLAALFNKIKIILAASFLSNASNIEMDSIQLTYIGHKFLDIKSLFSSSNYSECEIFSDIYQWVYANDDKHDKLDLSRNIISRYLIRENNNIILPNDTLNSIQSAHAIYLKENVEKYIETKNKVAEISTELSIKSKDVVQYFMANFKNNNLVILSFFTSLFIFNTFSDDINNKIFTDEKYYLSLVFLLISLVYLLITRYQFNKDARVNIRYFFSMKKIYIDIFDKKELDKLFDKRHLKYSNKHVYKSMNRFSVLWLIEVILLFLLTLYAHYYL